jgi:hypothetical protein
MTEDDLLMERLRSIADRVDGPPEFVEEFARAALSTRRIDSELAELIMDSATGTPALARDDPETVRLLSFETASVSIELQVHDTAETATLRGLVAGAVGEVVVETAHGRHTALIDADGWFTVDGLELGLMRLRMRAEDGTAVTTSWVSL